MSLPATLRAFTCVALLLGSCNGTPQPVASSVAVPAGDLVKNGGFEQITGASADGWEAHNAKAGEKGTLSFDTTFVHGGTHSLKLEPNARNDRENPIAVAQVLDVSRYAGQQIEVSGFVAAQDGTTAFLSLMTIRKGRAENIVAAPVAGSTAPAWTHQKRTYTISRDPASLLIVVCFVNGTSGVAWFDDVSVTGVSHAAARPVATGSEPLTALVHIDAASRGRSIPRTLFGTNVEWRWNATNLWREKEQTLDPQLVKLTRDLGVTLIRYPGGVYSDSYHWKQGVGPRESRPEVVHEPGKPDKSRPNFGTDEALTFAASVGAELLITVNAGTGTPEEAADWVRYVNARELRVRYWEVGNELYLNDNSPASKAVTVDPQTYVRRFVQFARAMKAADPRISIGAIGGANRGRYNSVGYPDWDRIVLQGGGDLIDFFSVHNAYAPIVLDESDDLRKVYGAMLAAPQGVGQNLATVAGEIARYSPTRASHIRLAVTEWGPFFQITFASRYIDHPKTLGSALYTASVLKQFIESPNTDIANFWMLHDWSVLGAIGSRNLSFPPNPDWIPTARYYATQLFTEHFGDTLVKSTIDSPTYNSEAVGFIDAIANVPYLDVVTSVSADGSRLYVMAINRHFEQAIDATVQVAGFNPNPRAEAWTLNGTGMDANTGTGIIHVPGLKFVPQAEDPVSPRFSKGGPGEVTLASSSAAVAQHFTYRFPAHSVTSLVMVKQP